MQMSRNRRATLFVLIALAGLLPACAGIDPGSLGDILQSGGGPLDDATIVSGLREALQVGTQRASASVSRTDGYFGNARIRIPLPQELESAAGTLRSVGLGGKVDEFELAMNRAAEAAAGEAVDVFWTAIKSMTIADARGILNGPDTAATAYFRRTTEAQLEARFAPIVNDKMTALGTVRVYDQLVAAYEALPLTTKPAFDPRAYVTDRALDGLFAVLGDEEKRIRDDPAARTTELLRKVFGR
jgi:hypothetical protein